MPYRAKCPCVYILASARNGTLYIGVTSDLFQRITLHKQDLIEFFHSHRMPTLPPLSSTWPACLKRRRVR